LRRRDERDALLGALEDVDRLVLLGDMVELRHGPLAEALSAARPALAEIGAALGPDREVVIVPGNHDHMLLRGWSERRALSEQPEPLGLSSDVNWREGELLAEIASSLGPARVRAAYPGVWLREDVYAAHGHYADRHNPAPIIERLGAGVMARVIPEVDGGPLRAEDYEATLRPMYAWIEAVAQAREQWPEGGHDSVQIRVWRDLSSSDGRRAVRRAGLRAGWPLVVRGLNRARLGPLEADVSGEGLRRGGLRGFAEVLSRLQVGAGHAIFGHTHRAGPLAGDSREEWTAPTGTRMMNIGSWTLEPSFLGNDPATSPYRPGFSMLLEDDREPELRNLLD
jgi:hypothetical protein